MCVAVREGRREEEEEIAGLERERGKKGETVHCRLGHKQPRTKVLNSHPMHFSRWMRCMLTCKTCTDFHADISDITCIIHYLHLLHISPYLLRTFSSIL